ncbi:hypothetical protein CALCODRAFT_511179 [Calocera cornea HHB12733]|uniref:CHAT domain-containing protein n=1 Tax=Calocera cornea HHB12733 TaxID=1353952 RepID=A0A165DZV1_9BASI|nr:hypothetical protein CALCODRAFT_511179 [Calocera cornea HHB12733]
MQRADLDAAVRGYEALISELPPNDADLAAHKVALVEALLMLSEYTADIQHSRRASQLAQEALDVTSPDDPSRVDRLAVLGRTWNEQAVRTNSADSFRKALEYFDAALKWAGDQHPRRGSILSTCGLALDGLVSHAEGDEQLKLARRAVENHEEALRLLPQPNEERAAALRYYAQSLVTWNDHSTQEQRRLDDAVSAAGESVRLTPQRHFRRHHRLNGLAFAHYRRWRFLGVNGRDDMLKARQYSVEAVKCIPQDHQAWRTNMLNLSASLVEQYEMFGNLDDLDNAISGLRKAIAHLPKSHPHRAARLSYLGKAIFQSFRNRGLPSMLDEAIECHEEAVELAPLAEVWCYRQELGEVLVERYLYQREVSALDDAVQKFEDALVGGLPHQRHQVLANLANALAIRSAAQRSDADLERAIECFQQVIDGGLQLSDPSQLSDAYGMALLARCRDSVHLEEMTQSAQLFTEAITSAPHGHPSLPKYYCHFGTVQRLLYRTTASFPYLEQSVLALRTSVEFTNPNHPLLANHQYHLAISLIERFNTLNDSRDFLEASTLLRDASLGERSHVMDRWTAARERAKLMHEQSPYESLESYRIAVALLPRLAWLGLEEQTRYEMAQQWIRLGNDAAACAIAVGQAELAVEFLENSRSVLWNQLFHLGQSHEEVRRFAPALVDEMDAVGRALEANIRTTFQSTSDEEMRKSEEERAARSRRRLAERWDQLLREVRAIPGAHDFLGWSSFANLRQAATSGPVVAITVSQYRCDGIIITRHGPLHVFQLPSARIELIELWARHLIMVLSQSKDREGYMFADRIVSELLELLWRDIGYPLWLAIAPILPHDRLSRVWLMPTGALASLPLHAALSNGSPRVGIQDVMIPSYTPTLSAMIRAQRRVTKAPFNMLAIGSPNSAGHKPLPCWRHEKDAIRNLCPAGKVTVLEDEDATLNHVLQELPKHNFLHICCHGEHDWMNPYRSHLALCDGRLTLSKIAQQRFQTADFAFLSACHTARVDPRAPDEAVHLASGMNLAGFRSIIATMWGIADTDAPVAAQAVYRRLTRGKAAPNPTDAAEALHEAVKALRRKNVPVIRWAPYIHIGL